MAIYAAQISTRGIFFAITTIVFATIVSTSSDASELFLGSVDAPLTFTEGQGTTGDSFNAQCVSCVQGPLNDLPKPFGLDLLVFDIAPTSPLTQIPTPTGPYNSEVFGGDINFSLINPDGTTQFSTAGARLSEEGPLTIGIEGTPGTQEVVIQITIPGPVTVNDNSGEEGPGPTNYKVNGDLYVGIFGDSNTKLSTADVGPPFVDCSQPGSSEFCSETFLSFTLDATLEVSTSPISFSSVFPHSATSIPEPSTWAMMLLGFAGLGFVGWRGSRRTVAFAE